AAKPSPFLESGGRRALPDGLLRAAKPSPFLESGGRRALPDGLLRAAKPSSFLESGRRGLLPDGLQGRLEARGSEPRRRDRARRDDLEVAALDLVEVRRDLVHQARPAVVAVAAHVPVAA